MLTQQQARDFYDGIVEKQDQQGYYEEVALAEIYRHGGWSSAESVVEFGSGTGLFARELLSNHLSRSCEYLALDQSPNMLAKTKERLEPFSERTSAILTDGGMTLPIESGSADRFASHYVLDLLCEEAIRAVLAEARRVLRPGGLLCLTGLTHGFTLRSRLTIGVWGIAHRLRPRLVGGCRPIHILPYLGADAWSIEHYAKVHASGIPSEAVVAARR